jgi:hypothetical protein
MGHEVPPLKLQLSEEGDTSDPYRSEVGETKLVIGRKHT